MNDKVLITSCDNLMAFKLLLGFESFHSVFVQVPESMLQSFECFEKEYQLQNVHVLVWNVQIYLLIIREKNLSLQNKKRHGYDLMGIGRNGGSICILIIVGNMYSSMLCM